MGKTRDLFKKIRDTKGTFHAKMGSIKERNGTDLKEAEDIKKRWQKYKKDLHDQDNHNGLLSLSSIRVVSSAYLRLLIFLPWPKLTFVGFSPQSFKK